MEQIWGKDKPAKLEKTVHSIWEKVPYAHENVNFDKFTLAKCSYDRERYDVRGGPAKKKKSNLSLILPVDLQLSLQEEQRPGEF